MHGQRVIRLGAVVLRPRAEEVNAIVHRLIDAPETVMTSPCRGKRYEERRGTQQTRPRSGEC
jgi:hypothetical protein